MCLGIPKMLNCYIILESFIPLEDENTPASLLTFLFAAGNVPCLRVGLHRITLCVQLPRVTNI